MRWRVVTLVVSVLVSGSAFLTELSKGPNRAEISGIVVDQHGDPVKGCRVRALFIKFEPQKKPGRVIWATSFKTTVEAEAKTDAEGEYVLKGLSDTEYFVQASANGFVVMFKDRVVVGSTLDWVLEKGRVLTGQVVDLVSSAPVVGATVRGWYRANKDTNRRAENYRWNVDLVTDEKGFFTFKNAPPETLKVLMWHDEYENFVKDFTVAETKMKPLLLRVARGLVVEGDVTNAKTGKPIENAKVVVTVAGSMMAFSQNWSDTAGRFRVTGLPRGPVEFEVTHTDFETTNRSLDLRDNPQKDHRIVFSLSPVE